ncbi:MAG: SLBB domain-containing protein [Deltaproteobacteria bacterium]|nr:SLBB domain-containing protein [Deltaproteobacteria bacterium]MCL5276432.1 SLBB domain-containing protein [Deltaproteobacteria bacterium]
MRVGGLFTQWQKAVIAMVSLSSLIYIVLDTTMLVTLKRSDRPMAMVNAMEGAMKQADAAASVIGNEGIRHASVFVLYKSSAHYTTASGMESSSSYISFFTFNAELQYALLPMPVEVSTGPAVTAALRKYDYVLLPAGDTALSNDCESIRQASMEWLLYRCKKAITDKRTESPVMARFVDRSYVSPAAKHVIEVYVFGTVKYAGSFTLDDGARLTDTFTATGGRLPGADLSNILIMRHDKLIKSDLVRYLRTKDPDCNPLLKDDDVVYINSVPHRTISVFVFGAARRTGRFTLKEDARLVDTFTLTGGPLPVSDLSDILILRRDKVIQENLLRYIQTKDIAYDPLLKNGDVIYIRKVSISPR